MRTQVVVRTRFSAIHHWPECPIEEVSYLRESHRHEFHVEMKFNVRHSDRDIEFIVMKNRVDEYLQEHFEARHIGRVSCEDIAGILLSKFKAASVAVFEDGENGAIVYEN